MPLVLKIIDFIFLLLYNIRVFTPVFYRVMLREFKLWQKKP